MTTQTMARPTARPTRVATRQLARIEGRRLLRHPAPWLGLALSALWVGNLPDDWASARYEGLMTSVTPLLLGVSLAAVPVFARERVPLAEDAPLDAERRSLARLLGGLSLVALVAVVVTGTAVWMAVTGGIRLGDEPGRTDHAHYTVPELLQPVLLACFAVALGAAVVHVVRQRLVASIVLFLYWFLVGGSYWLFNGDVVRWLTPLQVQPLHVVAGPAGSDPTSFPGSWLLAQPGEFQENWDRLVVSPSLAAWHDAYLVALTLLLVAVAVPGRLRRPLLVAGAVLAVGAVVLQRAVTP